MSTVKGRPRKVYWTMISAEDSLDSNSLTFKYPEGNWLMNVISRFGLRMDLWQILSFYLFVLVKLSVFYYLNKATHTRQELDSIYFNLIMDFFHCCSQSHWFNLSWDVLLSHCCSDWTANENLNRSDSCHSLYFQKSQQQNIYLKWCTCKLVWMTHINYPLMVHLMHDLHKPYAINLKMSLDDCILQNVTKLGEKKQSKSQLMFINSNLFPFIVHAL